jgi:hypothetical protein
MGQFTPINRQLALIDVGLVIASAARDRHRIAARHEASLMVKRHPDCGMTEDEICAAIIELATQRGLQAH